jgi:hypothetical protein
MKLNEAFHIGEKLGGGAGDELKKAGGWVEMKDVQVRTGASERAHRSERVNLQVSRANLPCRSRARTCPAGLSHKTSSRTNLARAPT